MNRLSIKLRITLWYTLIMVAIATAALMIMFSWSRTIISRDITGRLARTVNNSARMQVDPQGRVRIGPDFMYFENGVHLALYRDGERLAGQIPFAAAEDADFVADQVQTLNSSGTFCYILDKEIPIPGGESLWLRGAVSVNAEEYMLRSVIKTNLIVTVILILAAAVGGYLIVKRALKPVNAIRKTAKEISESRDLSRRISIAGTDEISQLAITFDEMLTRIEQAMEREKQFTSDVSHELRTPVAVIMSECEYMRDCAKTQEEWQESAASVMRQSERMRKLIAELLSFSRMDNGTQQLQAEVLDFSELLTFVCEEQREIHGSETPLLTKIIPSVYVNGDRFLLTRLLINLISNAYQYNRDNREILVSLEASEDTVCVSVQDHGIGIKEEEQEKIWERFYQVDPSRSKDGSNSMGLGLSMVRWIARQHGGDVTVRSAPGVGSTFLFTMPRVKKMEDKEC